MKLLRTRLWLIALILIGVAYCALEAVGEGDLLIFLSAANDLDGSTDIYAKSYFGGFHYYYSVLFAILLKPLCSLPYYGIKLVWLMLNLFLFCHLFYLLVQLPPVKNLGPKQKKIFLFGVFLFSFRFLHENIHASQITILILWLTVIGLKFVNEGKNVGGALLLAAGISIKLLPVVLIPYLIYRGFFKATLLIAFFYMLILFSPSLFIGHEYNTLLIKGWWNRVNPTNAQHVLDVDERSFHGLSTLLSTLLVEKVPDIHALPLRRNILDVSENTFFALLMVARAAIALITLFFLKWPPFTREKNQWQKHTEVSYLLLAIPLIFPHQQHYAFLFAVPAFACVLFYLVTFYHSISYRERFTLLVAMIFIYLCGNLRSVLGEFNEYYEHYKILTYGALALIPLLMWVSGKKDVTCPLSA